MSTPKGEGDCKSKLLSVGILRPASVLLFQMIIHACLGTSGLARRLAKAIHWKSWNFSSLGNFPENITWILIVWLYWASINLNGQCKNRISEDIWTNCLARFQGAGVSNTAVPLSQLIKCYFNCFRRLCFPTNITALEFKSDVEIASILMSWEPFEAVVDFYCLIVFVTLCFWLCRNKSFY